MPTLGLDVKVTLTTKNTRQSIDAFYRGIKVEAVQILPYASIADNGDASYNLEGTNFVLFIGDVYDGSDPFDLVLINQQDAEVTLTQTNFMVINTSNLKTLLVKSSVEDKVGYKVYFG